VGDSIRAGAREHPVLGERARPCWTTGSQLEVARQHETS